MKTKNWLCVCGFVVRSTFAHLSRKEMSNYTGFLLSAMHF